MANQEFVNDRALSPEVIISEILAHPKTSGKLQMSEVAKIIFELDKKGIPTTNVLCYKTGSSVYCEDLDRFVSKLVSFGYATDSSPIQLTADGIKLCEDLINRSKDRQTEKQLSKLEEILNNY